MAVLVTELTKNAQRTQSNWWICQVKSGSVRPFNQSCEEFYSLKNDEMHPSTNEMPAIQTKSEGRLMLKSFMNPMKARQLKLLVKKASDQGKAVSMSRSFIQDGSEC